VGGKVHGREDFFVLYLFATGESRTHVHCSMGWSLRMLHSTALSLPIPATLPFLMPQSQGKTFTTEKGKYMPWEKSRKESLQDSCSRKYLKKKCPEGPVGFSFAHWVTSVRQTGHRMS